MKQFVLQLLLVTLLLVSTSGRKGHRKDRQGKSKHCQPPSADEVDCNTLIVECDDQLEEATLKRQSITCLELNHVSRDLIIRSHHNLTERSCDVLTRCKCTVAHRLHCKQETEGEGDGFAPPWGDFCFSGNTLIETDKGVMDMRALQQQSQDAIRIKTMDADGHVTFAPVIGWFHASDINPVEPYNRVVLEDGRHVDMSNEHVLYTVPCGGGERQQRYAAELSTGDCLLAEKKGRMTPTPIVGLSKVQGDGIYSPATTTGTVLANGIGTSCYPTKHERMGHFLSLGMFMFGRLPISKSVPGIAMLAIQREETV